MIEWLWVSQPTVLRSNWTGCIKRVSSLSLLQLLRPIALPLVTPSTFSFGVRWVVVPLLYALQQYLMFLVQTFTICNMFWVITTKGLLWMTYITNQDHKREWSLQLQLTITLQEQDSRSLWLWPRWRALHITGEVKAERQQNPVLTDIGNNCITQKMHWHISLSKWLVIGILESDRSPWSLYMSV